MTTTPIEDTISQEELRIEETSLFSKCVIQAAIKSEPEQSIRRYLRFLRIHDGDWVELQGLHVRKDNAFSRRSEGKTIWAHANSISGVCELLASADNGAYAQGLYLMQNMVDGSKPRQHERNQWDRMTQGTKDSDIVQRRAFYIDIDPKRPSGTSATSDETASALEVARTIVQELVGILGNEDALAGGFSGNGVHIHVAIDTTNDAEVTDLIKGILACCHRRFSTSSAIVDNSVFDARRLAPAFGTFKRKGDETKERPHRRSVFWCNGEPKPLGVEQLRHLLASLEKVQSEHEKAPPSPSKAPTAPKGSTKVHHHSPLNRWNKINVRDVGDKLGLNREHPKCPFCGKGGDRTSVHYLDQLSTHPANVLNCKYPECADRPNKTPVNLVAKVLFHCDNDKDTIESFAEIDQWFQDNFQGDPNSDGLQYIVSDLDYNRAVKETIGVLGCDPEVYQRSGELVRVVNTQRGPEIVQLCTRSLPIILSKSCRYVQRVGEQVKCIPPPSRVMEGVFTERNFVGVRHLSFISGCPVLRPDGTILSEPGWDEHTRILYVPQAEYPAIPENPTKEDAQRAAAKILEPFGDFPFQGDVDKAVVLSIILTKLSMSAHSGPVPIHAIDGNVRGVGKDLLGTCISIAATGAEPQTISHTMDEAEQEKRMLPIIKNGTPISVVSNIRGRFGGQIWESMTTSRTFSSRVLGASEMWAGTSNTLWLINGNNLEIVGDMSRRVLRLRFKSPLEKPETRRNFAIPNIKGWMTAHKIELQVAALTILRAFALVRSTEKRVRLGSFEEWATWVPSALVWLGYPNIIESRFAWEQTTFSDNAMLGGLLTAWFHVYGSSEKTLAEILQEIAQPQGGAASGDPLPESAKNLVALRQAILNIYPKNHGSDLPSAQSLGSKLHSYLERRVEGKHFVRGATNRTKIAYWSVKQTLSEYLTIDDDDSDSISAETADMLTRSKDGLSTNTTTGDRRSSVSGGVGEGQCGAEAGMLTLGAHAQNDQFAEVAGTAGTAGTSHIEDFDVQRLLSMVLKTPIAGTAGSQIHLQRVRNHYDPHGR